HGLQKRDWLFVSDAAMGLVQLGVFAAEGGQGIYNLCSGMARSTRDVVMSFATEMGADMQLLRFGALPSRMEEPSWVVGDPTAMQSMGWCASTNISQGITRTLEAFRSAERHEQDRDKACAVS